MKTILICLMLVSSGLLNAQSEENQSKFVVFIVNGFNTTQEARQIDQQMRLVDGIIVSRMDIPTHRYYAQFESDQFSEAWFEQKFLDLGGYTIHCYTQGIKGVDPFVPITLEDCEELN